MAKSIEQILGYVPLTGMIQAVKTGIPNTLPQQFWSIKKNVIGDSGRYTQVSGTRTVARQAMYGSPAVKRNLKGVSSKDVKLIHSFEEIQMDPLVLQRLRSYDNYDLQKLGIQEVDRQQAEFRANFDNLRVAAVMSMLSLGYIYFDAAGNLLPSSSSAAITIDYGVGANNRNQLNGVIASTWATATNDIPLQLRNLKDRSLQQTGYELKYAFYGSNIPSYLTANNYVKDYLARNVTMSQKFLEQSAIPDGLFGYTWVPVHQNFYEDSGGTNRQFFSGDTVVFTPEIDQTVYEMMEGSYFVPSAFNAQANLAQALGSMKQVYGMFGYALPTHNPLGVAMFAGDTFLPVWKVPDALYIADVTP